METHIEKCRKYSIKQMGEKKGGRTNITYNDKRLIARGEFSLNTGDINFMTHSAIWGHPVK